MGRRLKRALGHRLVLPGVAIALISASCSSSGGPSKASGPSVSPSGPSVSASTSSGSPSAPLASSLAPVHGTYSPKIDPSNFVATIDNPYFPLKPGTTFLYKGVQEDGTTPQTDEMVVTHQTKMILGVSAVVVRDTVSSQGQPIERTFDWYAQDRYGNVWYMGEDSREVKNGSFVKTSDSWEAGVDGAEPGIIMPGNPQPGIQYRQEYYPHYALDQARVLGRGGPIQVPFGSYQTTLLTVETAPQLDPGVAEDKYYVAGLGDIKEETVSGNHEEIELIRVTH
jgi:hypothetical protein